MTELRDARLRKALDEAPDAALQPHRRTREAIRAAAHAAVQPAWRAWWTRAAARPTPWAAAFATVVLATIVTLLWEGREVPAVRKEPPAAVTAPAPAAAPPAPAPAPPAAAPAAAPRQERPLAKAQPAREEPRGRGPEATDSVTVAPAAPPSPAPAPAPAPAAAAPAAVERQSRAALAAATPWTQLRVSGDGRSVVLRREPRAPLADLVARALIAPSEPATAAGPATLQVELAQGEADTGVLELVDERWRWTPAREPREPRLLRLDPALAGALRDEARRVLAR